MPTKVRQTPEQTIIIDGGQTVLTSLIEIFQVNTHGFNFLSAELENSGVVLTGFEISAKFSPDGAFNVLYDIAADFTSPVGFLLGASGDLTILADAAVGWFILDCRPFYSVQCRAICGTSTELTVNAGARK